MKAALWVWLSVAALSAAGVVGPPKAPIEKSLAGYTLDKTSHVALRDSKTGCYLVRFSE